MTGVTPQQEWSVADLHVHSTFSDGTMGVAEIAALAQQRGLDAVAITDHFWPSRGSRRGGLSLVLQRHGEIEDARNDHERLVILEGAEVDIGLDGELAPVAGGLEQFDIVIGSVHQLCGSSVWASAVVRAASSASFDVLGHWSGYLTSYSPDDGRRVAQALADSGIAIEINSNYPSDNVDFLCTARDLGCVFTLGSDAHCSYELGRLQEQAALAQGLSLPLVRGWPRPGRPSGP